MINFIRRNQLVWHELIILPHTIRDYSDTLNQFKHNCFVFCREKPSYEFVSKHAPNANTFLSHDLAFACNFDETKKQMIDQRLTDTLDFLLNFRSNMRFERYVKKEIKRATTARRQADVLNAFRTDDEKTDVAVPADNIDISRVFTVRTLLPTEALHTTHRMMEFISRFRIVETNRLHVGIMSAMLD